MWLGLLVQQWAFRDWENAGLRHWLYFTYTASVAVQGVLERLGAVGTALQPCYIDTRDCEFCSLVVGVYLYGAISNGGQRRSACAVEMRA
jgi:hypothetical protein